MVMVWRLLQDDGAATVEIEPTQRASAFHRALPAAAPKAKAKAKAGEMVKVVKVEMYKNNYHNAYQQWRKQLKDSDKTPTEIQWSFMDAVHHRCETEALEEHRVRSRRQPWTPT